MAVAIAKDETMIRRTRNRLSATLASLLAVCMYWTQAAAFAWAEVKAPASISAEDLATVKQAEAARMAAITKFYGSVVAIYGNDRQGGGSGVLYHRAGYALTNHHVVAAAGTEGWAGLADGKLYRWKLLGTDPGGDVAIIRLLGREDFPTSHLADSETVRVGDWAMAVGNPFVLAEDQRPTVTLGIVSGVHRYQPGDGLNTLVYGNCIQVDSSINPGNSGGPLFNLQGDVIGINGRGSFEERGRVNVGLGYAISANQTKHFIPDLLATKTVQHGTLDCQFGNRAGGVICQSINLNAPIARLGLELGDRLLAFEGIEIKHANQFTNLITTFPAEWPCEITFEHQGQVKTIQVRLTPLPYNLPQPPPAAENKPAEKQPDEKKPDEKKSEEQEKPPVEKSDDAKPAEKQPPKIAPPIVKANKPQAPPLEAGKIRFPELNRESTALLVKEWQATHLATAPLAVKVKEDLLEAGTVTAEVETVVSADRRFVVRVRKADQLKAALVFDGSKFWRQTEADKHEELSYIKAMRDPFALQAMALSFLMSGEADPAWGPVILQGGDKAQRQVAYRLAVGPDDNQAYVWLSVFNAAGNPGVALLKTGVGIHDDEPIPSLTYHDWKAAAGITWPHRKLFVRGLLETPGIELHTKAVEAITPTDSLFKLETP
jgi:S1-C subfamily serine protease